jgi:hypothetical protein
VNSPARPSVPGARRSSPPGPDRGATRISSAARWRRSRSRSTSEYQLASFSPKVMGSAWMPCVRPIMGVYRNSCARRSSAVRRRSKALRIKAEAACTSRAWAVSTTSLEVRPKWNHRDSGPTFSATAVVNATTSCLTSSSSWAMRSRSKSPLRRIASAAFLGTSPASARVSVAAISTRSQVRNLFSSLQIRPISGRV